MTLAQFVAAMLFTASLSIPRPEFHRHELARRDLARSLRGTP